VDGLFERSLPPDSEEALIRYVRLKDPTYPSAVEVGKMVVSIWEALQTDDPEEACRQLGNKHPAAFRRAVRRIIVTDEAGIAERVPGWLGKLGFAGK
jgi:hypothetical protein